MKPGDSTLEGRVDSILVYHTDSSSRGSIAATRSSLISQRELNYPRSVARLIVVVHNRGVDHECVLSCVELACTSLRCVHARLRNSHL